MRTIRFIKQKARKVQRIGGRATALHLLARGFGRPFEIEVTLDGISLTVRAGSPDIGVALSSLGGEFAPLAGLLPRDFDGLIVDAGGYIGTAALALNRLYPRAQVVSLEPATENYWLLKKNTAAVPNIVPLKAALVAHDAGPRMLRDRGTGPWGLTLMPAPSDRLDAAEVEPVQTLTLAGLRRRFGGAPIGVLKLDIEGAELDLFQTNCRALAETPVVMAELHDRIVPGCSVAFRTFAGTRRILPAGREKWLAVSDTVPVPAAGGASASAA